MTETELTLRIKEAMGMEPTEEQAMAIGECCRFLADRGDRVAMIMRGSAGTGKTTLAGAIVRALGRLGQKMLLLAPTGRAAKVFSLNAGQPAFTIHRKIYRQKTLNAAMGRFSLGENLHADTLFIIDEASMIANQGYGEQAFGSGCLLDDLVQYVYSGRNCRMMLIGDSAQLPPVGETESPALSTIMIEGYAISVYEANLTEVLRQSQQSGILHNATIIRQLNNNISGEYPSGFQFSQNSQSSQFSPLPKIRTKGFTDIRIVPGDELIDTLASSYNHVGLDETIVVSRSNKRANVYNQGIRNQILGREEELTTGDMLMIVKNNYYWTELMEQREQSQARLNSAESRQKSTSFACKEGHEEKKKETERAAAVSAVAAGEIVAVAERVAIEENNRPAFIANGDIARVQRVRNIRELYGFRFADITLMFPDYDDYEITCTVLLDSLSSDAPSLSREQNEQLFNAVMEDYAHIPHKADRIKQLRQDIYYNALQVKFAYAVTCHKAQGGQWAHVYIDQGYMTADMLTPDYIHWLYTAITRATEQVYLVNWPKEQREEGDE